MSFGQEKIMWGRKPSNLSVERNLAGVWKEKQAKRPKIEEEADSLQAPWSGNKFNNSLLLFYFYCKERKQ